MIYVALLRGINVGGHLIIKMTDLKRMLEKLYLKQVHTYIQSGNVVFISDEEPLLIRERIELQIKKEYRFDVTVIIRSALDWDKII